MISGGATLFLELILFLKLQSQSKLIQTKSKSNPFLFCSSFFLCLQDLPELCPELCGCYRLLQSCFSFFISLLSGLLATTSSSLSFLSNSFSSPRFNILRVARRCFSWSSVSDDLFFSFCTFLVLLLALSFFASYPQPFSPLFFSF